MRPSRIRSAGELGAAHLIQRELELTPGHSTAGSELYSARLGRGADRLGAALCLSARVALADLVPGGRSTASRLDLPVDPEMVNH